MAGSPRMVGREAQLATVVGRLRGAGDGRPGMVVVTGDAGTGKTRLVREVAAEARGDGWTVLTGACVELSEGAAMLAPVAGVLRQLARDRGDAELARSLQGPTRRLARLVPELGVDTDDLGDGSSLQVLVSFHRLLRDLAREAPVLLVVEDLHWADSTTRDLVRHLSSRMYDERLLVLVTVRSDDLGRRHPLRPVLAEVVRRSGVDRVDLPPLADEELVEHLGAIAGDRRVADLWAIAARAGGNPFYAEELLEVGAGGGLPPSLEEVLTLRLERLPVGSQQLLGEAAVLGATVDAALLASVTTLQGQALREAVRAALEDGVLLVDGDGYSFRHALLREVALDRLLPDERTAAHAAAAAALEADPDRAVVGRAGARGQAAHHWWEARDLPRCLSASVAAAEEAEGVFADAVAMRHLRRAIELWGRVDQPEELTGTTYPSLLLTAARVAWEVDDANVRGFAAAAIRAADEAPDPMARSRAAFLHTLVLGRFGRGELALEIAAAELDEHSQRTPQRALALVAHATTVARVSEGMHEEWDPDAVAADLDEALAIARERGDRAVEQSVLAADLETLGPYLPDRAAQAGSQLAALDDGEAGSGTARELAVYWAARQGYFCGRYDEVESALSEWEAMAGTTSDAQTLAWVVRWSMWVHVDGWSGRLDRALARLDEVDLRDYEGSHHLTTWMVWAPGDVLRWTGQVSRALDRAELGANAGAAGYHRIWNAAELAASRAAAGVPVRQIVADASVTLDVSSDRWWPWGMRRLVDAVAAAAGGRPLDDDVLGVVDGWLQRLERYVGHLHAEAPIRPWATACLQRARAERAFLVGAPEPALWDPVVADLDERGGVPHAAVARLRRATARAAVDGGASPACEDDLLAAWRTFTRLGMTAPGEDAVALARRLRVRLPGSAAGDVGDDGDVLPDLTGREREVLALVARGWTNKRVGQHLFISPKTVSVHLSNAMRKLDVDTRTQAVVAAHRAGLVEED